MGTAKLNIWLRNAECNVLETCWRTDLVIQTCTGKYIKDSFPEVIDQLKERYSKQGLVKCINTFPLVTDQTGKTLTITVGTGTAENLLFTGPSMTFAEIYAQMQAFFQNVDVRLVDGSISIITKEYGPGALITIGGDSDLVWGPVVPGSGYTVTSHFYQNAWRIMLQPGSGKTLNHIEVDVPPGCYRVWSRVCHGNNEETSVVMVNVKCAEHACVNLLLPTIKTCAAHLVHPLMDKVVHDQFLMDDVERLLPFRALMYGAGLGKQDILGQLDYRVYEAQEKGDPELEARILAVRVLAELLPECY